MSNKRFKSALRRLRNGVPIYCKSQQIHKRATFKVEMTDRGKFRAAIIIPTDMGDSFVSELWEAPSLDQIRRIARGYYPAVAKAFGPARLYVGI